MSGCDSGHYNKLLFGTNYRVFALKFDSKEKVCLMHLRHNRNLKANTRGLHSNYRTKHGERGSNHILNSILIVKWKVFHQYHDGFNMKGKKRHKTLTEKLWDNGRYWVSSNSWVTAALLPWWFYYIIFSSRWTQESFSAEDTESSSCVTTLPPADNIQHWELGALRIPAFGFHTGNYGSRSNLWQKQGEGIITGNISNDFKKWQEKDYVRHIVRRTTHRLPTPPRTNLRIPAPTPTSRSNLGKPSGMKRTSSRNMTEFVKCFF